MRTLLYGYSGKLSDRNVSSIQDYVKVFMQELEKIRTEEEVRCRVERWVDLWSLSDC